MRFCIHLTTCMLISMGSYSQQMDSVINVVRYPQEMNIAYSQLYGQLLPDPREMEIQCSIDTYYKGQDGRHWINRGSNLKWGTFYQLLVKNDDSIP